MGHAAQIGGILAECQTDRCRWFAQRPHSTAADLRDVVQEAVTHFRTKHPTACRTATITFHSVGEHCDHEARI